jgi:hypothetical protein
MAVDAIKRWGEDVLYSMHDCYQRLCCSSSDIRHIDVRAVMYDPPETTTAPLSRLSPESDSEVRVRVIDIEAVISPTLCRAEVKVKFWSRVKFWSALILGILFVAGALYFGSITFFHSHAFIKSIDVFKLSGPAAENIFAVNVLAAPLLTFVLRKLSRYKINKLTIPRSYAEENKNIERWKFWGTLAIAIVGGALIAYFGGSTLLHGLHKTALEVKFGMKHFTMLRSEAVFAIAGMATPIILKSIHSICSRILKQGIVKAMREGEGEGEGREDPLAIALKHLKEDYERHSSGWDEYSAEKTYEYRIAEGVLSPDRIVYTPESLAEALNIPVPAASASFQKEDQKGTFSWYTDSGSQGVIWLKVCIDPATGEVVRYFPFKVVCFGVKFQEDIGRHIPVIIELYKNDSGHLAFPDRPVS